MGLAVVDVEVERAGPLEDPARLDDARLEEGHVVVERVGEGARPDARGGVAHPLEAGAVARLGPDGAELVPALRLSGVEGRIDVHEIDGRVRQRTEDAQVVAEDHARGHGLP